MYNQHSFISISVWFGFYIQSIIHYLIGLPYISEYIIQYIEWIDQLDQLDQSIHISYLRKRRVKRYMNK